MPITINGSGAITGVTSGVGKILQVAQATSTTQTYTTSTTYADATGLTVNITPSATTSKVLIMACVQLYTGTNNSIDAGLTIVRSGTTVFTDASTASIGIGTALNQTRMETIMYLDSPSSISALTYKIQVARTSYAGSYDGGVYVNRFNPGNISSITVFEVAA